jgi:hypothetical protein
MIMHDPSCSCGGRGVVLRQPGDDTETLEPCEQTLPSLSVRSLELEASHSCLSDTWVREQLFHGAIVLCVAVNQLFVIAGAGPIRTRDVLLVFCSVLGQLVAQNERSFSTRQVEADKAAGLVGKNLRCYRAQARWATLGQCVALFTGIVTAATLGHLFLALWTVLYRPVWRQWRLRWKLG